MKKITAAFYFAAVKNGRCNFTLKNIITERKIKMCFKNSKNLLSMLVLICMLIGLVPVISFANSAINVNVSIVSGGSFVSSDGDMLAYLPISVTDLNENEVFDIDDVLSAAHNRYCKGGYGINSDGWITKFWGIDGAFVSYYHNNQSAYSITTPVEDGDSIYAFIYRDAYWGDEYTYFENNTETVGIGQSLSLSLTKDYFGSTSPLDNAVITVNGEASDAVTNSDGEADISFNSAGVYMLSAISEGYIICPPVCYVTVTEGSTPSIPDDTETDNDAEISSDGEISSDTYKSIIGEALEKIAESYRENTAEWNVMDMAAYEDYAPETANKLSENAVQSYINYAINTVSQSATDSEIAKAIIILTAIEKNPELLYTVNSNTAISAVEKLNSVTHDLSLWRLPYVLMAYNQGDYGTEAYEETLIESLLDRQKSDGSWDEYGTLDTTGNVLAALAFYKDRQEVASAMERAVYYLSTKQLENGSYSNNSNTTAVVVIGLCAAGIDLREDPRFITDSGKTLIDGLLSFMLADKSGFGLSNNTTLNAMSTEQCFRALIALMQTIKTGEGFNIYDYKGNTLTHARATGNGIASAPPQTSGENITVTLTIKSDTGYWLNGYKVTLAGDNAKVYHALVKGCDENGISYTGAQGGYVSSITKDGVTLEEKSTGPNSGWLYKVNGVLPDVALTDCGISNGDKIVWFYTNDWTTVPGAIHYGSSSKPLKDDSKTDTTEVSTNKYTDVSTTEWYYNDVKKASEMGLLNGIAEGVFAPYDNITRAMFVTVIYRYDGEKGHEGKASFKDLDDGKWYSDAVVWAAEKKVASGYDNGNFGINDNITRAELITMLYRYSGEKSVADLSEFSDCESVADWARNAMMWATKNGIIIGDENKSLNPNSFVTRAEAAAMIMRYIEKDKK